MHSEMQSKKTSVSYNKEYYEVLADLRSSRKRMKFTHIRLAKLAGVSPKYLAKVELGASDVSLDTLLSLADAMDKKLKILFE